MLTVINQPTVLPGPPPGGPPVTVVWDVDGTLVLGDTLLPFLRRLAGTAGLTRILLRNLIRYARSPGRRTLVKTAVLREVLTGRDVTTVETMARDFVADLVLRRVYAIGGADRPIRALADVAVQVGPFRALPRAAR
jgi:phosphoserine phosphatase